MHMFRKLGSLWRSYVLVWPRRQAPCRTAASAAVGHLILQVDLLEGHGAQVGQPFEGSVARLANQPGRYP